MNLIYDNHKTGVACAEMIRQIETLRQVTVNHFRDEEAYMR
jgi:hemerythrin